MLSERDPEFLEALDGVVQASLCRICGPARDHFIDPEAKTQALLRLTNMADEKLIRASIRRLVRSGRISRTTRRFAGRTVAGIVCVPQREWERLRQSPASSLRLTDLDVAFLRSVGVVVDREDICEAVPA
jgi:hypothetical protein